MKNVLLCGLMYDSNFGDPIINKCCKYIIENILNEKEEIEIHEIDLSGKKSFTQKYKINRNIRYYSIRVIGKIIEKLISITKLLNLKSIFNYLDLINWYFSEEYMIMKKYYKNKVRSADIIVFVGGGIIKYKYQNFYHYIDYVTKIATESNVPVYLNSVGVEGYDRANVKCRLLKEALNRNCVKGITTRDDIERLTKYIEKNISIGKVADPAVFTREAYSINKRESEIIGLGVCRKNLFIDNEIQYMGEELIRLWTDIIKKLEDEGVRWRIYTNGLREDNEFAEELCETISRELGINCEGKMLIPSNDRELIEIIASFKGIIATRLHSSIIAYSLGVPSVGLVWNEKLKFFGETIGYPERFVEVKDFKADLLISKINQAIIEGYNEDLYLEYKNSVKSSLQNFLNEYI